RAGDTARWRKRLQRGAAVYPVEVDGTTFDLLERFSGLKDSKTGDRQAVATALGKLLRRALELLAIESRNDLHAPRRRASPLQRGRPPDSVFRLLSGAVDILRELDGDPILLGTVGAGQFIGEMGVVENRPRNATASAICRLSLAGGMLQG